MLGVQRNTRLGKLNLMNRCRTSRENISITETYCCFLCRSFCSLLVFLPSFLSLSVHKRACGKTKLISFICQSINCLSASKIQNVTVGIYIGVLGFFFFSTYILQNTNRNLIDLFGGSGASMVIE